MPNRALRLHKGVYGTKLAAVEVALLARGVDRRDAGLFEQRVGGGGFAVDELGAELDRNVQAAHAARPAAAAEALARLEHEHRATGVRASGGGREPCRARADDDYIK